MQKALLVGQLTEQLRQSVRVALTAGSEAAHEAQHGATPAERRENAQASREYAYLAKGQKRRAAAANREIDQLERFRPQPLGAGARVALGAVVEIEDEESGEGRTFFLAPAGAGRTLTGPGGDGMISVVTPSSPIGKAVLGKRRGDVIDVTVKGEVREWAITYVG
jgi:transcription elongation GreA/GreB family factor